MRSSDARIVKNSFFLPNYRFNKLLRQYKNPLFLLTKYCNEFVSYEYECKFLGVPVSQKVRNNFHSGVNRIYNKTRNFIQSDKATPYEKALENLTRIELKDVMEFKKQLWTLQEQNPTLANEEFGNLIGEFSTTGLPKFKREFGQRRYYFDGFRKVNELLGIHSESREEFYKYLYKEEEPTEVILNLNECVLKNIDQCVWLFLHFFNQDILENSLSFTLNEIEEFVNYFHTRSCPITSEVREKIRSTLSQRHVKRYYQFFLHYVVTEQIRGQMYREFCLRQAEALGPHGYTVSTFKDFVGETKVDLSNSRTNEKIRKMLEIRKSPKEGPFRKTIIKFNSDLYSDLVTDNQ